MNKTALTASKIEALYQEGLLSEFEYEDLKKKFFKRMAKEGK